MGWFSNLIEKLNPAQTVISRSEPISSSSGSDIYDFRQAYENIEVVHRGVELIINAAVDINFDILGTGPIKKIDRLLNIRPNPFVDRVRLFRQAYLDFLMDGNVFFYYDQSDLYLLPAYNVTIITDPKTFVKQYNYEIRSAMSNDKNSIIYSPEEIIHIKDDSDKSIFRGKSRLSSLKSVINIYNSLLNFQKQFFKNNAIPGLTLETDSVLSKTVKDRLLQEWKTNYTTIFNGAKTPAILDGGLKVSKISEISFQNLDFEKSVERLERDISKGLGIPYNMLQPESSSNLPENQVLFFEHTVLPIVKQFSGAFQQYFNSVSIIPDKRNIIALQPDLKTQALYYTSLVNTGIITPNEAREKLRLDLSDDPDMDKIRIPQNITGSATRPDTGGRPTKEEQTSDE